jgi:WS/DGAT/MGAT family acyltransferase
MASRLLDPVDTLWLNMDRAENQMVIESLMLLDRPPEWDSLLALLERRLIDSFPVFHRRPVSSRFPLVAPRWEDDPDFALERHVHRVTLPPPGDQASLQRFVSDHMNVPLPRDRPLWESYLVDGLDSGAAMYTRLHHAMADGIALTRVVLSLTDAHPAGDPEEPPASSSDSGSPASTTLCHAGAVGATLLALPRQLSPWRWGETSTLLRRTVEVGAKLLLTRNPPSALAGAVRVEKRALWAPPLPLGPVVDAGHRTGTTVNDVLMAALAGAIARYLRDHDGAAIDVPTMVPVDVRPADVPLTPALGNQFALVLLTLPSGLTTPFARLAETKRRMDAIKQSPEAMLTFGLIRGIGRTGPDLERLLVDFFANKATGVTTNVPGPSATRYLAGRRITAMLGWVPESGAQTLGTAIFSYDGYVSVGFKFDADTIEHPEQLLAAFVDEVETLCRIAG